MSHLISAVPSLSYTSGIAAALNPQPSATANGYLNSMQLQALTQDPLVRLGSIVIIIQTPSSFTA